MAAKKQRRHEITIVITFNRDVSRREAIYAAWNNFHEQILYGGEDDLEPWAAAKARVLKK